jgi:hypothetical protein
VLLLGVLYFGGYRIEMDRILMHVHLTQFISEQQVQTFFDFDFHFLEYVLVQDLAEAHQKASFGFFVALFESFEIKLIQRAQFRRWFLFFFKVNVKRERSTLWWNRREVLNVITVFKFLPFCFVNFPIFLLHLEESQLSKKFRCLRVQ